MSELEELERQMPRELLIAAFSLRYPKLDAEAEIDALLRVLEIAGLHIVSNEEIERLLQLAHRHGTAFGINEGEPRENAQAHARRALTEFHLARAEGRP